MNKTGIEERVASVWDIRLRRKNYQCSLLRVKSKENSHKHKVGFLNPGPIELLGHDEAPGITCKILGVCVQGCFSEEKD